MAMADPPEDPDTRDLRAARAGDGEALGRLLQSCRDYLSMVAARGHSADLTAKGGTSDLVQETLLGAYRDFGSFRGDSRSEFLAWLGRILRNHLAVIRRRYRATHKRSVAREVSFASVEGDPFCVDLPSDSSTPCTLAERREESDRLLDALSRLPENDRRVVVWRQYDGLSFEEIGPRLGRSAGAARKVWSRALIRLTKELRPTDPARD